MKAYNGFFLVTRLFQDSSYPIFDASISTVKLAFTFIKDKSITDFLDWFGVFFRLVFWIIF